MEWRVIIDPHAEKDLDSLDWRTRERIVEALFRLATNPLTAPNVKSLTGGGYRLRVGDYRVLYTLKNEILVVLVVKIGHRREVYR
ncbi:MAG: type II toxin-antitoxin system RelE/ParE family toxin [Magnetococcales bacterium]|nr:type II toxin-antitoxin system RelE/ParE family toxin [Magnetococcales bacterium]MBF0437662.1 type II toxin-antitoxin system RelE/ParE family toxin [Magnetococcales bacterium]